MLQRLVHRFIKPRHFWRHAGYDELSEIYTSMMMRSLGFSLMGIFVPVYLYMNGLSLQAIFLFFAVVFLARVPFSIVIAYIIARIGPKHAIALSTILLIGFLSMLLSYTIFLWPIGLLAMFMSFANGMFFIAYHIDFSKIKHSDHGGKEVGYSVIFERIGAAAGPLVGGVIASLFIPELTILLAILVLLGSLVPLFLTNEPVKRHQHITFKGFNYRKYIRNFSAIAALSIEHILLITLWPLFAAVTIFENNVYAKLGAVVALGTIVSVFAARFLGSSIDRKKGKSVLLYGSVIMSLLHLIRPFVNTTAGVLAMNTASEPTELTVRLPLIKGYYDEGDTTEEFRIVYFAISGLIASFAKGILFLALFIASFFVGGVLLLQISFVVAAIATLSTLTQKFAAL